MPVVMCPQNKPDASKHTSYVLDVLTDKGLKIVSSVMQKEGRGLLSPGEKPLKDITKHFKTYTASQKWLLNSISLLVLRPIFATREHAVRKAA